MRPITVVLNVIILAILLPHGLQAQTNPSDSSPYAPMAVHNLTQSQQLQKTADGLSQEAVKEMQQIFASGGKASSKQLAAAHLAIRRLERAGMDLQMHGETAGTDFLLRAKEMQEHLQPVVSAFVQNPANARQMQSIQQSLESPRKGQALGKAHRSISQLAEQENWVTAYTELQEAFDDIASHSVFLPYAVTQRFSRPFDDLNSRIAPQRHRALRAEVQRRLEEAGKPMVLDAVELTTALRAAASALESAPAVDVAGQSLSGPQCLDHFLRQWQQTHWGVLRLRAIDWARRVPIPNSGNLPIPDLLNRVDEAQYGAFCQDYAAGLVAIIAADAKRATATDAQDLFTQYLQVLGPTLSQIGIEGFEAMVQTALDELVAKSPELAGRVAAYQTATDEVLRWRARIASEAANARQAGTSTPRSVVESGLRSEGEYHGLLAGTNKSLAKAILRVSCPEILLGGSPKVVGQPVHVGRCAALPVGAMNVSVYSDRLYTTLTRPDFSSEILALKQDLLTDDRTPPLSLAAAVAIATAEKGDLAAAGGTIDSLYLEGVIPRFAALPAAVLPMVPLGPIPPEQLEREALSYVLVRLQLAPKWVAHTYFFIDIPQATTSAGPG